ncbi:HTH-type transcriptional regulator DmlR [Halioglobus japonicus]|nr:HTH-type transcriptional regulator DmlR [Halioglobus japonicus]
MESLTDVAVYVRVVEEGSFTRAAEHLGISRSVISKYVTRLEDRLGARLLNRTTRRLSLTEAGRIFYERSRRSLQDIEEAEAEISQLQQHPRGILRINSPMSFGILHLAPLLPGFQAEYPDISIDMNLDDRKIDIVDEGYDVSIRISEMPDSSLVARRLASCRHAIVASPSYLETHGTPRTPEDLLDHNVLSFSYQSSVNDWHFLSPKNQPISVAVNSTVRINNSLAIREALLGGMGIARIPTFVIGQDLQRGSLLAVLEDYKILEVSIYLVYPQRRHLSPKVRAFVDYMASRIAETPYWDQIADSP